ncbi:MAG: DDE-type integrase/transposase/recombinase, partial [Gammaproteobacteria bacterium]|nr:DDE-type integrase/transposase/recombinase [Gammaproteobacteria bacterium]
MVSIDAACAFIENEKLDSSVKEKIARKATEINIFHQRLGHPSEASTIKTAELNRVKLKGKFKFCESCIYGKAHQKPVKKWTGTRATVPYERVFVDITSLQHTSLGGSKHWAVVVDDATRFRWSFFMKDKSCLSNIMTTYLTTVRQQGHSIKFIRCDNAGENLGLKRICNENGIKLEMTSPNTPQQNGVAERSLTIIRQRAVSMMECAGLTHDQKTLLWAETFSTATTLVNLTACTANEGDMSPYQKLKGCIPLLIQNLRKFGVTAFVTNRKIKGKLDRRAKKCLFVGYTENHADDCFRFYNPVTRKIILSRDVTWDERKDTNEELEKDFIDEVSDEYADKLKVGSSYEHVGDSGDTEETDEDYPSTSGMQNREAIPESHEAIMPQIDQLQNLMAVSENMEGATIPVTFERAIKEIKWKDA